jgi:hypothetical protein
MDIFAANVWDQIAEEYGVMGADAFLRELQTGIAFDQGRTKQYVSGLAEVHTQRSGAIDGFGRVTSAIPENIWHSWNKAYPGFWSDPTNEKWFLDKHPQFRVGYQCKTQVAWKPTLDRTSSGLYIGNKYGNVHTSN